MKKRQEMEDRKEKEDKEKDACKKISKTKYKNKKTSIICR